MNTNHEKIMETCLIVGPQLFYFGTYESDERSHHFLHRVADIAVFLRWFSDNSGQINRIGFSGHFPNMKNGKRSGMRVMAEMISQRSFPDALLRNYFDFQHQ